MPFSTAYEEELEIIDENDPYFIGRTDQWTNHPDGKLVLGYHGEYGDQIIPIDYYKRLGKPDDYREKNRDCGKHICISGKSLKAPKSTDLVELGFCSGCHESAKEYWMKLMKQNSHLGVSQFI